MSKLISQIEVELWVALTLIPIVSIILYFFGDNVEYPNIKAWCLFFGYTASATLSGLLFIKIMDSDMSTRKCATPLKENIQIEDKPNNLPNIGKLLLTLLVFVISCVGVSFDSISFHTNDGITTIGNDLGVISLISMIISAGFFIAFIHELLTDDPSCTHSDKKTIQPVTSVAAPITTKEPLKIPKLSIISITLLTIFGGILIMLPEKFKPQFVLFAIGFFTAWFTKATKPLIGKGLMILTAIVSFALGSNLTAIKQAIIVFLGGHI